MLLHSLKSRFVAGTSDKAVLYYGVLNAGSAHSGAELGVVFYRDTLILYEYSGYRTAEFFSECVNCGSLLFQYFLTGHSFFPPY